MQTAVCLESPTKFDGSSNLKCNVAWSHQLVPLICKKSLADVLLCHYFSQFICSVLSSRRKKVKCKQVVTWLRCWPLLWSASPLSPASAACCIRSQTECPVYGTRVCPPPPVSCWPLPQTPWPASWSWPLLPWSSPCCHRSHCRDCSRELSDSTIISRWKTLLITHNHFPHLPKGINVAINKVIISPSQKSITNWKLGPHHQRNVTLTY